jgi:hypothetical protein
VASAPNFWPGGLVVSNEKCRRPSFAGDEGTPLGAGTYFSDAFYFCGDTARPPEDAALWPWGYLLNTGGTWCTDVASVLNFWPGGLVVSNEKCRRPSFAGDESTPLGAGTYFSDASCLCGDTARPPEDAAL